MGFPNNPVMQQQGNAMMQQQPNPMMQQQGNPMAMQQQGHPMMQQAGGMVPGMMYPGQMNQVKPFNISIYKILASKRNRLTHR